MSEFEKNLRAMLEGENEEYRQANADLHQEVAAASDVVAKVATGARLTLKPVEETPMGTTYMLTLETTSPNQMEYELGTFRVHSNGYPISAGASKDGVQLDDRTAIATYLAQMAGSKDSPLVQYLAFLTRRQLQKQH
jgi:hypothetical protein